MTDIQGIAIIPDDVADGWEAAKEMHAEAVRQLQRWDPKMRAYLGANLWGMREDGRRVVFVEVSEVQGKTRRDLRMAPKESADERPGTIIRDQRLAILGGFTLAGLTTRNQEAKFIKEALAAKGYSWEYGADLGWLSRHQAGLVLMALQERAAAPRG